MAGLRGRLTYANVVATLALFLALGGGVTIAAISGKGRFKHDGGKVAVEGERVKVLKVPGVAKLQLDCAGDFTGDVFAPSLKNISRKRLQVHWHRDQVQPYGGQETLDSSERHTFFASSRDTYRVHVFRANGAASAEITFSFYSGAPFCDDRWIVAQALSGP